MRDPDHPRFDAIVIGSGFGGAMAAWPLVAAGRRVLMLERGGWVERGEANWGAEGAFVLTPHYGAGMPARVLQGRRWQEQGLCSCVGGPSVFYGGASFRFREADFRPGPEIVGESGAQWPFGYPELEPYYGLAERLIGVAGEAGADPTEPFRSEPYPSGPGPLAAASRRIAEAARSLGLSPFRIPLAINYSPVSGPACVGCTTCDAFACAVSAKNDLATRVIPRLMAKGLALRPNTVAVRLVEERGRVVAVECHDRERRERVVYRAERVVLAAGALATPHLLLASGLERRNPAGAVVGRYLMRHCNAMMYGLFARRPNPSEEHHKQIAIHDFYFGDPDPRAPAGKLGNIQQVMAPPLSLIRAMLPGGVRGVASLLVPHLTGLLVIAEDQPRPDNRVEVDRSATDPYGLPRMRVVHRYTRRDQEARRALLRRAREVLRRAGARATVTWKVTTFSHAVGTVRMGPDPDAAPLDERGRFRGVENLFVTDGSALPTSAGVNPSLTIAANALRVGSLLAEE